MSLDELAALFHKPNQEAAQVDASRAAEEMAKTGSRNFRFSGGTTHFLVCPPYSAAGRIIKTVFHHNNLPLCGDKVAGTPLYCPEASDPEAGRGCPICSTLRLLHQSLTQLIGRNPGVDVQARISSPSARAQYNFNGIILSASDPSGQPLRDKKGMVRTFPRLPYIVACPAAIGNVVALAFNQYGEGLYNPSGAIRFQVVRTGSKDGGDVRYTATMLPDREPLALDIKSGRQLIEAIYDLDVALSLERQWTRAEYERSVAKATALATGLQATIPISRVPAWGGGESSSPVAPPQDLMELGAGDPAPPPPILLSSAPDPAPVASHRLAEVNVPTSPASAAAPSPESTPLGGPGGPEPPKDPDTVDPATGRPFCFGTQPLEIAPGCKRCRRFFDVCMMETTTRSLGDGV